MFRDREEAGRQLGRALAPYRDSQPLVLAIPRGGVPVGYSAAKALDADFDIAITRKIPIPWEPEAGFGAVGPDGEPVLNDYLVAQLGFSKREIESLAREVQKEVLRRERALRLGRPPQVIKDRVTILVDDGLASGFTMIAALKWTRKAHPRELAVAVPCSSDIALEAVRPWADTVVALEVSRDSFFAVASFYERWWDLTDEEVLGYMKAAHRRAHYRR